MASEIDELVQRLSGMKMGARNNGQDRKTIQMMHDLSCKLGASCDMNEADDQAEDAAVSAKIARREDVNPKEGERQYGNVAFADERNKKYPIDSEEHIRAAWNYISKEENAGKYDPGEVETIKKKIIAAWKEKIDPAGPPAAKSLNLSYVKSLGLVIPDGDLAQKLAVKRIGQDEIRAYTFIWGHPEKIDLEREYFDRNTNFWDQTIGKSARPLTWDHAQDETMKDSPVIGTITDFGDDEVGRWYTAHLDRAHRYRKAVDALIEEGALGSSSDSALQYIRRVKKGGATYIAEWPWFATALTDVPCEPRTLGSVDYFKSLGIEIPEAPVGQMDAKAQARVSKSLQAAAQKLRLFVE